MNAAKILHSVLVVSSSAQANDYIKAMLDRGEFDPPAVAGYGSEARRMLSDASYDVVIVNSPLSDEYGQELAVKVSEESAAGVILLVKSENYDEISHGVRESGVLTVSKPLSRAIFGEAIQLSIATCARCRRFELETKRLQGKIDELRIVARAKCVLVEYLQMSEAQAHRYIEKQAMDMRTARVDVAKSILKAYENN